jgi:hypothetical protein
MPSSDRYAYRHAPDGFLSISSAQISAKSIPEPFYEALVVDVILDQFHPKYSKDGYNVGMIKIRLFTQDHSRSDELLSWAYPMDSTIQEMPLIGELVMVNKVLGNFFYSRKLYIAHRMQENAMINLNKVLDNRPGQLKNNIPSGEKEITLDKHKFGKYFKPDTRVRPLKHFEGDVIIQGRMGNSIRFGSSQMEPGNKGMAPNIILRAGQAKDVEKDACTSDKIFGLIIEDPDKDVSSIWMTSDQVIPFEQITKDAGSNFRSLVNHPQKYDGGTILINSDRVVLDAKKTHIMLFSNEEIYLNSYKNTAIDTDSSILLTANIDIGLYTGRSIDATADADFRLTTGKDIFMLSMGKTSLLSNKIFIGTTNDDEEPMVGGASLSKWLARLILALMGTPALQVTAVPWVSQKTMQLPPAAIPGTATTFHTVPYVGTLSQEIVTALQKLYLELAIPNSGQFLPQPFSGAPFNSGDNFVRLANDIVQMEKNNFKNGKQTTIENNTWLLKDSYYKVI